MNWEQFGKYIGIQGVIALLLMSGYIIMTVTGKPVTQEYVSIMMIVVGFFFGKNGYNYLSLAQRIISTPESRE